MTKMAKLVIQQSLLPQAWDKVNMVLACREILMIFVLVLRTPV
jgi:hypothetical protein